MSKSFRTISKLVEMSKLTCVYTIMLVKVSQLRKLVEMSKLSTLVRIDQAHLNERPSKNLHSNLSRALNWPCILFLYLSENCKECPSFIIKFNSYLVVQISKWQAWIIKYYLLEQTGNSFSLLKTTTAKKQQNQMIHFLSGFERFPKLIDLLELVLRFCTFFVISQSFFRMLKCQIFPYSVVVPLR